MDKIELWRQKQLARRLIIISKVVKLLAKSERRLSVLRKKRNSGIRKVLAAYKI